MLTIEPDLNKALEGLSSLHPKKIDLSLERLNGLLKKLGSPERTVPPVIHVAGTNGKGSTVAFMRAILEAAGQKVHVYTSPHLVSFRERIRLAGKLVDEPTLIKILKEVSDKNSGDPITFFEITTAAAFLLFSRVPADVLILEVGLGGKFDATNVIDKPIVSVITPIGLDHAEFLGTDLEKVAGEKGGIIKNGCPVVSAPQLPGVMHVLKKISGQKGASLKVSKDLDETLRLGLLGDHQIVNAATAVTALKAQKTFQIDPKAISQGLQKASWPARLQTLPAKSFGLPEGVKVILDGGHNPMAGEILGKALEKEDKPVFVIFGMMKTKDAAGFLAPIVPHAKRVLTIPIEGEENAADPEVLCQIALGLKSQGKACPTLKAALDEIPFNPKPLILITGSLYLAGGVLKSIGYNPK